MGQRDTVTRPPAILFTKSGGAATAGAMARNTDQALVDVGGCLGGPSAGRVETVPLGGGRPRTIVANGSEPTWTG
jgi:hypothetical protein